jgi:phosphohistidine phosphatase
VLGIKTDNIFMDDNLYYKMSFHYLHEILSKVNDYDTVILFGHNPSFSEITSSLVRGGCDFMPKCGIVSISFNIKKWSEVKQNAGHLKYFLKPEQVL